MPKHHDKVIIQIGQESDTDDSHYDDDDDDNDEMRDDGLNSDFIFGAINDLLREARHGPKVCVWMLQCTSFTNIPEKEMTLGHDQYRVDTQH